MTVLAFTSLSGCQPKYIGEAQARQAAKDQIKKAETALKIDASKLPELSGRTTDVGFDYSVRDETQNVSIFVHVNRRGVAELGWLTIDEERRTDLKARGGTP